MDIVRESPDNRQNESEYLAREGHDARVSGIISLPALLRSLGATILIAAAATFLLQEWSTMSHVMRYFSFLAFTLLLSLSGFVCGLKLKEDKSARTFLAIAAAVVPVHFCQLGALIYSCFPEVTVSYPSWLLWKAPSAGAALGTAAAGLALLLPVVFVSFSSLVRGEAGRLTALYLAINAVLLVPLRSPDYVAVLCLAMFGAATYVELAIAARSSVMRTKEGRFVRIMVWVPLLLLALRALNLYGLSFLLFGALTGCAATFLLLVAPRYFSGPVARSALEACSVPFAFLSIFGMAGTLAELHLIGPRSAIPAVFLPFALALFAMSREVSRFGGAYRYCAGMIALLAMLLQLAVVPGFVSASYCLVVGLAVTGFGFQAESRGLFFGGLAVFALGILYYVSYAVDIYAFSPWMGLAGLGIAVVFAASLLERKDAYLAREVLRLRERIAGWR